MGNVAKTLLDAKVGDTVYVFDSQAARYDENKKYQGRGCWKTVSITGETRASFVAGGYKFDRKTGDERDLKGYSANRHLYGEIEKEEREYISENRRSISVAVEACRNVEALKKIKAIIDELA